MPNKENEEVVHGDFELQQCSNTSHILFGYLDTKATIFALHFFCLVEQLQGKNTTWTISMTKHGTIGVNIGANHFHPIPILILTIAILILKNVICLFAFMSSTLKQTTMRITGFDVASIFSLRWQFLPTFIVIICPQNYLPL